ncbi:uncharacterized protein F4807DRAFT_234335 [Annulohypoxylon truncatum]|uniref:uncharacterized protein n=1 Tax=Annulohypoxylon truncatum TaxID=327061 RepID=UPI00200837FB|nr:uncharacterized protein F4807DRAFT_234335 [Annulohypoxylon truncatum]KAI1206263.1 hypothetical protein F4807DRAFT_234335 [Annulohypoxylon truncatum]
MEMEMDIDPPEVSSYTHEQGAGPSTHAHGTNTPRYIPPEHTLESPTFNPSPNWRPSSSIPAQPPQIHAPTPRRRRIGGGLAVQTHTHGYGTPSPTPSPSPRSPGDHDDWRASADALQADIAAQFEAEDRVAAPGGRRGRKRKWEWKEERKGKGEEEEEEGNGGDGDGGEGEGEGQGDGDGDGEVDRLLDNLVWWLAETRKRRKLGGR